VHRAALASAPGAPRLFAIGRKRTRPGPRPARRCWSGAGPTAG